MELIDALRSTGAVREFTAQPVTDETLARILETARFAPNGGNAQSWHVVVVRDPDRRRRMAELYQRGWYDYVAMREAGLRPWAPTNDRADERAAVTVADQVAARGRADPGFAENFADVPVMLALFADVSLFAAVDRDLDRYTYAGGASIYPFAWSILLAAHAEGLGGVLTTMSVHGEDAVQELLGAPPQLTLAAVITLGHPVHRARRLRRDPVDRFTTIDTVDGPTLNGPR